ncbi:MAG: hypothetical protein WCK29_00595 [archaeon]
MDNSNIRNCYGCSFIQNRCGMIGLCAQDSLDLKRIADISQPCMYDLPVIEERKIYDAAFGVGILTPKQAFEERPCLQP